MTCAAAQIQNPGIGIDMRLGRKKTDEVGCGSFGIIAEPPVIYLSEISSIRIHVNGASKTIQ